MSGWARKRMHFMITAQNMELRDALRWTSVHTRPPVYKIFLDHLAPHLVNHRVNHYLRRPFNHKQSNQTPSSTPHSP